MFNVSIKHSIHILSKHTDKGIKFNCKLCDFQAISPKNLKLHITKKDIAKIYSYQCDRSSLLDKGMLKRHSITA